MHFLNGIKSNYDGTNYKSGKIKLPKCVLYNNQGSNYLLFIMLDFKINDYHDIIDVKN